MAKDINYYLSLGFNEPAAAYFDAGRRKIISESPNPDYTLTLKFDNGETRLYDCKPLLRPNTVFAPLIDRQTFRRVYLDEQRCVSWDIDPAIDSRVVWNNKIDLSPDSCYLESEPLK